MAGILVDVEGGDCVGKTVQAKLLVESLAANGKKVKLIDFPAYDTPSGQMVARYLKGELGSLGELLPEYAALLYSLDRYQFATENKKALEDGYILIANRYTPSNIVYQASKLEKKEDRKQIMKWIEAVESRMPQPDDVIYLDLSVNISQELMRKRVGTKGAGSKDIHENNIEYLKKVRKCYLEAAEQYGWIVIDCKMPGKNDVRPPEEIHENIITELRKHSFGFF